MHTEVENVKAIITVSFNTCNLIDSESLKKDYNDNMNALLIDILNQYPLKEIIDSDLQILKVDRYL